MSEVIVYDKQKLFRLIRSGFCLKSIAMFLPASDGGRSLWINKGNDWSPPQEWEFIGKLLGLAVYNGVLLDLHLPAVLYKKLLGQPVGFEDLAGLDPGLHAGLKQLLEFEPAEEVEAVFCRSFEVEWQYLGSEKRTELRPNGANIPVTHSNRGEYVNLLSKWLLTDSVEAQFSHLLAGFHQVIHPVALQILRPDELEILMAGIPHLVRIHCSASSFHFSNKVRLKQDFHELEAGAGYVCGDDSIGWGPSHPTVQAFWEVVHSLELDQKQRLLLFATGSAKAPIGGLRQVKLQIHRMCPDSDLLPTSHTCFNALMLPQYSSKEKLRDRLLVAINECEGFGLK